MFSHHLPNDDRVLAVYFSDYAKHHFLKRFEKSYGDRQWGATLDSIIQDLSRIATGDSDLQRTQQVDELWHKGKLWIFKYDFRVAQTKESTKSSGNRCVTFLDAGKGRIDILLIFGKDDLPKNKGEQAYIKQTIEDEFAGLLTLFG